MVKRGDPVEFSEQYEQHYELGGDKARYGICLEDTDLKAGAIKVRTAEQKELVVPMYCVHAVSWSGWIPEELEDIQLEIQPMVFGGPDDDYY